MRLTGLTLDHYGPFERERISFDPRPDVINLLLLNNGGGKSVLRGAFCDLLFGISGQSEMGFRYGYKGMRVLADAIDPAGTPFTFGRRKGNGNTLVDALGGSLDAGMLARYLGRMDRKRLERLFALDTDRLRAGEADLLRSDGELGQALVSGAGGTQNWRALRKELVDRRDAIAPTRRSALKEFYAALDRYTDARKRKDQALLKPDQWHRLEAEREADEAHRAEASRIAERASAEIARLERIRRVRPFLAMYDNAATWLDAHPDAPNLDLKLLDRLTTERDTLARAEQRAAREKELANQAAAQLAAVTVDQTLLAEAEEVDRLVEAAGAARKAQHDLPAVAAEAASRAADVARHLRDLGLGLAVEQAGDAIPPRPAVNRVRRLTESHAARQDAQRKAPALIAARTEERDRLRVQLTARAVPEAMTELAALAKRIREYGDPTRNQREVTAQRQEAQRQLEAAMARVPGWTGDATALVTLSVLSRDAYERCEAAVREARAETLRREEDRQAAQTRHDAEKEALLRLTGAAALPDAEALTAARVHREQGWQLIYRRAFTPDPPAQEEEQAFAGSAPLPLAYAGAVKQADDIADQLMRDAEQVAQAQAAKAALSQAESRLQAAAARCQQADAAQAAAEQAWRDVCAALPLGDAPSLAEVRSFLDNRDTVITRRQALLTAEAAEADLAALQDEFAAKLREVLGEAGSLPDLLAEADKRLAAAQRAETERAALQGKVAAADKALAEAEEQQRNAASELAAWRKDWAAAMAALSRPADEDPAVTADMLEVLADLDKAHRDRCDRASRVEGMQRDIDRFTAEVRALVRRVAPDLEGDDPFPVIASLRQKLQQTRAASTQRDTLREQAESATRAAQIAATQLSLSQEGLRAVLLLVGAETVEEAADRLRLASERATHAQALAQAEAKLVEAGDGHSLAELRAEVAQITADEVPGRIEAAERQRAEAQKAAQDAAAAASAKAQLMAQAEDATGAVDAAADQQAAVATLGRVLEEALVHHVAAEMLHNAIARVEEQEAPKALKRIEQIFTDLTDGAYTQVMAEAGDDAVTRLTLKQRDYPDEVQAVKELSEGTRDQLYLALRLAAIEEHAVASPVLPFIGDDILQTFDDGRALAAMRVLRNVSRTVQVILLTHHRHVLDLAARLPEGAVHVCRLGSLEAA